MNVSGFLESRERESIAPFPPVFRSLHHTDVRIKGISLLEHDDSLEETLDSICHIRSAHIEGRVYDPAACLISAIKPPPWNWAPRTRRKLLRAVAR